MIPTGDLAAAVRLTNVPEPEPGDDELLIEVEAFSVNRGETFLLDHPEPGWRPGKDIAGLVVRAARSGAGPTVGERVVAHAESGGWAERVAVTVEKVAALPPHVSVQTAAALPLAGMTALRLLRACGSLSSRTRAPDGSVRGWSGGMNATIRKFHYAASDRRDSEDLTTLTRLLASERLHPEIGVRDNWRHTNDVITALLARQVRGNAILTTDT
jgi:hypothetical protein